MRPVHTANNAIPCLRAPTKLARQLSTGEHISPKWPPHSQYASTPPPRRLHAACKTPARRSHAAHKAPHSAPLETLGHFRCRKLVQNLLPARQTKSAGMSWAPGGWLALRRALGWALAGRRAEGRLQRGRGSSRRDARNGGRQIAAQVHLIAREGPTDTAPQTLIGRACGRASRRRRVRADAANWRPGLRRAPSRSAKAERRGEKAGEPLAPKSIQWGPMASNGGAQSIIVKFMQPLASSPLRLERVERAEARGELWGAGELVGELAPQPIRRPSRPSSIGARDRSLTRAAVQSLRVAARRLTKAISLKGDRARQSGSFPAQ